MKTVLICYVLKTIHVWLLNSIQSIVQDKKEISHLVIEMAKLGTVCGCPNVNRLFNCKEDEIEGYLPKSLLENQEMLQTAIKSIWISLFNSIGFYKIH